MTDTEFVQELAELLQRFADLQLEYAELCMLKAGELQYELLSASSS